MLIMYPFIWFYAEIFDWHHLAISVVLLWYLIIDPDLLVKGKRENGTNIPRDNYARVYAEVSAITATLYGDYSYLYLGKKAF